jgi:protocatechuate 3,4-dioxygenase, beta subunit
MKINTRTIFLPFLLLGLYSCKGQTNTAASKQVTSPDSIQQTVGGGCEGCELIHEGMPPSISSTDTSTGWSQAGQKILLTGIIYQRDGKTPAPNVILYYYHTNTEGKYVHKADVKRSMPANEKGQTHGYIRGWIKTDSNGKYAIYTVRPGAYPGHTDPAHIHVTIKEPNNIKEYYIDEFVFDDDKLLTTAKRSKMENRCGSGVLRLVTKENLQIGERNIILGLNIPDYPYKESSGIHSGKNIGEDVFSFTPFHAWGPDKATKTCPVCKYGWYHGILFFAGNHPNWDEIRQWLVFLEAESIKRQKYLKVYFVYGNEKEYNKLNRDKELEKIGSELQLKKVALTFVPSFLDKDSEIDLNSINPDADNTFILYKRSRIIEKFINLKPTADNFQLLIASLDLRKNENFDVAVPAYE